MSKGVRRVLSGWGRFPKADTQVLRPERMRELFAAATSLGSMIPRGLGRSYGDASFNSDGNTVLFERLNRFLSFDGDSGVLESEAGVTIDEILSVLVPRGFFPSVTPGTRFVTLGGCLACDVHGKNHHREGSISKHVLDFHLLTARGAEIRCSREENPELFWATFGGMGLTGCITRVRMQMKPIETSYFVIAHQRAECLDEVLRLFDESDKGYQYSVAWIDCLAKGRSLGRSVIMRGNPARLDDLPARMRPQPLRVFDATHFSVPFNFPRFVLNRTSVRAFNGLYFRRHPRRARNELQDYGKFFYPLDGVRDWNRIYGRAGFVQYQCVFPLCNAERGLSQALTLLSQSALSSFLAVLKRLGPSEQDQLLSFPMEGYTLALDLPWRGASLLELLDRLDALVIEHEGRVYLAKDARMSASTFRQMYHRFESWLEIKRDVDPENMFTSDLSRRLQLGSPAGP